ncbi:hypothetical protein BS17DRAFT_780186 [Gyrodon lividus]|nr:hypothetical protein BS17DRAFT_780186 [Gyrodon lividus]
MDSLPLTIMVLGRMYLRIFLCFAHNCVVCQAQLPSEHLFLLRDLCTDIDRSMKELYIAVDQGDKLIYILLISEGNDLPIYLSEVALRERIVENVLITDADMTVR